MNAITQAFEALAERRAAHHKTRADLAELREAHTKAGDRVKRLRVRFADVAGDAAEAERAASEISTVEHLAAEQVRLISGHQASERSAQEAVHRAEREVSRLRQRRRDLEQILTRTAEDRAKLVHRAEQAERTAEARRGLVVEHDRAVSSLKAEFSGLAEPESASEVA